ncbi:septum formation family protein [Nocardioides sp. SYSU D00065]|uniref:septum formation family protein n=1 Tax=Nocardioides sp. SYSU D00065 TaxID=2817378 RepID=UPI001B33697E|nr:septum formation family protein [Nocardioides sp. SYSU D00065]
MTRRLARCAVLAVLAGLLATAPTSAGAGAATASADPLLGAPAVGACFDLSAAELAAASYTDEPVACSSEHTSTVIAVAALPDRLDHDSRRLPRFALRTCLEAQATALGTSQTRMRLTAYDVGYFVPTPEQRLAGARWLRCDLVLGAATDLQPLPRRFEVGTYPFARSVSRCLAGRDFHVTVCSAEHTHRATGAVAVRAPRYPSQRAWQRLGTERCRSATTGLTYRFGWPSKLAWKAGERTLVCYTQTRR